MFYLRGLVPIEYPNIAERSVLVDLCRPPISICALSCYLNYCVVNSLRKYILNFVWYALDQYVIWNIIL